MVGTLIEPSPTRFKECVVNRSFGNRPDFVVRLVCLLIFKIVLLRLKMPT